MEHFYSLGKLSPHTVERLAVIAIWLIQCQCSPEVEGCIRYTISMLYVLGIPRVGCMCITS